MAIMEDSLAFSSDDFRKAMSSWATGVSVITGMSTEDPAQPIAIVCNSIVSISLQEKLILWSVDKSSSSYEHWINASTFLIHILAEDQGETVRRFAKKGPGKFDGLEFRSTDRGNPILDDVSVRMECATTQRVDTADHTLIIARLETLVTTGKSPLLYLYSSSWSTSKLTTNRKDQ
jgi:flavin reductase (DIM6/NTAB) family NADH-FMN oxidoreductase RutF